MTARRSLTTLVALSCALVLTGCGGGKKTGEGLIDPNRKPTATSTCGLLGCPTPTPTVTKSKTPTKQPTAIRTTVRPTAAKTTVRPTPAEKPFVITLNGDKSGKSLIDPPQAAVYAGMKVIWKNADTKPHGVQAQNGAFKSGPIPAGGSFTWVALAGTHAYQDSTRPYVNASITVQPR